MAGRIPRAVVHGGRIVVADARAEAAGVVPGQRLATALGLLPGLQTQARQPAQEAAALDQLACWAGQFTPTISLQPPATLLLEIGGCLRLFGGLDGLVGPALAGCGEQGYSPVWAVAPTPLAACWLARPEGRVVSEPAHLERVLADLPCRAPAWPAPVQQRLVDYGLRTLGDLRRLPGASLRQRLGPAIVDDLLRAWGELPDPRPGFVFPEDFRQTLELPARVEQAEALVFAGQRLLAALAGWLQGRQLALRQCTLELRHERGPASCLALRFGEPVNREARFVRLLRERLAATRLAAPVVALAVQAEHLEPIAPASGQLFTRPGESGEAGEGEGAAACLERLRARLGESAVQQYAVHADYRPETQLHPGETAGPPALPPPRPLWLLPVPQALAERGGRPHWHGPLTLLTRAERLESGWWDGGEANATGDIRRDYFIARNPAGHHVWIFQDGLAWHLHGVFA